MNIDSATWRDRLIWKVPAFTPNQQRTPGDNRRQNRSDEDATALLEHQTGTGHDVGGIISPPLSLLHCELQAGVRQQRVVLPETFA